MIYFPTSVIIITDDDVERMTLIATAVDLLERAPFKLEVCTMIIDHLYTVSSLAELRRVVDSISIAVEQASHLIEQIPVRSEFDCVVADDHTERSNASYKGRQTILERTFCTT